jgi:hypothetical protein
MSKETSSDMEAFALYRRELYTAVIGDIMDELGFARQFLPPEIKPLMNQPFELMLRALDDL